MIHDCNVDQRDFAEQLVHIATRWLAPMPADLPHRDPLPERLHGFVGSALCLIDGDGGLEPHRLSPRGQSELNMTDQSLRGQWTNTSLAGPEAMALCGRLADAVHTAAEGDPDRTAAMGGLLVAVARVIEEGYELVPQFFEEHGRFVEEGTDIAPGLAAAAEVAWAHRAAICD